VQDREEEELQWKMKQIWYGTKQIDPNRDQPHHDRRKKTKDEDDRVHGARQEAQQRHGQADPDRLNGDEDQKGRSLPRRTTTTPTPPVTQRERSGEDRVGGGRRRQRGRRAAYKGSGFRRGGAWEEVSWFPREPPPPPRNRPREDEGSLAPKKRTLGAFPQMKEKECVLHARS